MYQMSFRTKRRIVQLTLVFAVFLKRVLLAFQNDETNQKKNNNKKGQRHRYTTRIEKANRLPFLKDMIY